MLARTEDSTEDIDRVVRGMRIILKRRREVD